MIPSIAQAEPSLTPLPADFRPEWERVRIMLLRQGEPDWVPFMEDQLDMCHRERVIGRPIRTLEDEIEIAVRIGVPFIRITLGMQNDDAIKRAIGTHRTQRAGSESSDRPWVQETEGVIRSEADFEAFPWPDPDQFDYGILERASQLLPDNFKVMLAVGKVFNLAWWLMGFDNYCFALYDQPALVARLQAKVAAIQSRVVERALEYPCVGAVRHADDMAYRTGLMVAPAVIRQHVFPVYRRLNHECHLRDIPVIFHSDGDVGTIVEDILTAGFDGLNPIEPVAMDIRALKERVDGRISLIGNVDLSYTLTLGTPADVDAEVYQLISGVAPGGGFGLASANSIPDYVPWRNFVAMHAAWTRYGRYPIKLQAQCWGALAPAETEGGKKVG